MAQSQNSSVDFMIKATSFHSLAVYGTLMVGNKALEFYNERNPEDYVQIPWEEIDHIAAEVIFGRTITRFAVITKESGYFQFSTRDNKKTLQAVQKYIPAERMVKSASFFDVIKLALRRIWLVVTGRGSAD